MLLTDLIRLHYYLWKKQQEPPVEDEQKVEGGKEKSKDGEKKDKKLPYCIYST